MNLIATLRTGIWSAAGIIVVLAFLNEREEWIFTILALAGAAEFLMNFFVVLAKKRREAKLWNLSEFRGHSEYPPETLQAVYENEGRQTDLVLDARIPGLLRGTPVLEAPFSGNKCLGWDLQVDLLKKTKTGGEADFIPLIRKNRFQGVKIAQGSVEIPIREPGLLNAGHYREEILARNRLGEHPALNKMVEDELKIHFPGGLAYNAVRVRESFLVPEEPADVYGKVRSLDKGLSVQGNAILDDPGSLLIFTKSAWDKKRYKSSTGSFLTWFNLAAGIGLLFLTYNFFMTGPARYLAKDFPILRSFFQGKVYFTPGGQNYEVSFVPSNGDAHEPIVWDFKESSDVDSQALTFGNDKHAELGGLSSVTINRFEAEHQDLGRLDSGFPVWADGHWYWELDGKPSLVLKPEDHRGPLYVKNRSGTLLTVTIDPVTPDPMLVGKWTLDSYDEWESGVLGSRLVDGEDPILLSSGDRVQAKKKFTQPATYLVGLDKEILWNDEKNAWVFDVTREHGARRTAPIYVRNTTSDAYHFAVLRNDDVVSGPYKVEGGFGAKDQSGLLFSEASGKILLSEDERLRIIQFVPKKVFEGPLAEYSQARWTGKAWEIQP